MRDLNEYVCDQTSPCLVACWTRKRSLFLQELPILTIRIRIRINYVSLFQEPTLACFWLVYQNLKHIGLSKPLGMLLNLPLQ